MSHPRLMNKAVAEKIRDELAEGRWGLSLSSANELLCVNGGKPLLINSVEIRDKSLVLTVHLDIGISADSRTTIAVPIPVGESLIWLDELDSGAYRYLFDFFQRHPDDPKREFERRVAVESEAFLSEQTMRKSGLLDELLEQLRRRGVDVQKVDEKLLGFALDDGRYIMIGGSIYKSPFRL